MAHMPDLVAFTLADVHQAAIELLKENPEAIVSYRLLQEVLRLPTNNPKLLQAKKAALTGKWVRQLEESQLSDGSWGRFHSQDTKQKTVFRTTEEAIDRAFALGLEPSDKSSGGQADISRMYCMGILTFPIEKKRMRRGLCW